MAGFVGTAAEDEALGFEGLEAALDGCFGDAELLGIAGIGEGAVLLDDQKELGGYRIGIYKVNGCLRWGAYRVNSSFYWVNGCICRVIYRVNGSFYRVNGCICRVVYRVNSSFYRVTRGIYWVNNRFYRVRSGIYQVRLSAGDGNMDTVGGEEFLAEEEGVEVDIISVSKPSSRELGGDGFRHAGNRVGQDASPQSRTVGGENKLIVGVATIEPIAEGEGQRAVVIQPDGGDVGHSQMAFADNDMGVVDTIGVVTIPVKVLEAGEGGAPPLFLLTMLKALFMQPYLVGYFQVGRELGDEAEGPAMGLLSLGSGGSGFSSGRGHGYCSCESCRLFPPATQFYGRFDMLFWPRNAQLLEEYGNEGGTAVALADSHNNKVLIRVDIEHLLADT